MGNAMLDGLKKKFNYTLTENGGIAHKTTDDKLYDMFAFGAAMRKRSDEDIILMWREAYDENTEYALKCLFYLRDILEGQGERRFFRVCLNDLAKKHPDVVRRNLEFVPEFGRWDDLWCLLDTPVATDVIRLIHNQINLDLGDITHPTKGISLLGKWLPSENTSSMDTRAKANYIRRCLRLSHKEYRVLLTNLRAKINVLETLMSANRWDEIEFDKIPSKAGIKYKNAFARRDIIKQAYKKFMESDNTKVNAKALYPYEVVAEALKLFRVGSYYRYNVLNVPMDDVSRLAVDKYWDNLTDYFNDCTLNALCVVDTSGSMVSNEASAPINVAISLGLYCAERAKGPFKGNYISFSSKPQLIETRGVDFVDKVYRIYKTNLCENTDLEATFNMLLDTAYSNHLSQEDLPESIIVISDMEIDMATAQYNYYFSRDNEHGRSQKVETMMESMHRKWAKFGYKMPKLVYWNVNARHNIILDGSPNVSYVSGCSPVIFEQIMKGKTGRELMYDKLNSERYKNIK